MTENTPTAFEAALAEYLAACARAFDLNAWLDAKATRERWERATTPRT